MKKNKNLRYFNPLSKGIYRNMSCPCGSGKKAKKCHGRDASVSKKEYDFIMAVSMKANHDYHKALNEQKEETENTQQ